MLADATVYSTISMASAICSSSARRPLGDWDGTKADLQGADWISIRSSIRGYGGRGGAGFPPAWNVLELVLWRTFQGDQ